MVTSSPGMKQVEPLTASQIARFRRDGFLVLPAVLDPELCRLARNEMWEAIAAELPPYEKGRPLHLGPHH